MRKPTRRVSIEIDRSTLEWTVVEYHRFGWSVLYRCDNQHDAHVFVARLRRA